MGDRLTISGSGTTSVETDALYASAEKLGRLAREAVAMQAELSSIDRIVGLAELAAIGAPRGAARAELDMDQAAVVLVEIDIQAHFLQLVLNAAADGYGFVERFIGSMGQSLMDAVGAAAGHFGPGIALANPPLTAGVVGLFAAAAPHVFSSENNAFLSDPATVSMIRAMAMSSDDALLASVGVPGPVAGILGDNGLGITGIGFSAAALMGVGAVGGLFRDTPVHLAEQRVRSGESPAVGFEQRFDRVPDTDENGGGQVVIEKYETEGQPDRYEVFVAGTVTFSPVAADEPWDMTSNVANAVGGGSGSYDSVMQAMQLAGINESTPVQLTGYSQGAATAARIAESGQFDVQGFVGFGGPTGNVALPEGIPAVLVEHTDDLVVALGGTQQNHGAIVVERQVFAGEEVPTDVPVPAHHAQYYRETAKLLDQSGNAQVTAAIGKIDAFTYGATTVTSTTYRFERD